MSHRTYKDWVILYGDEPRGYKTWWCRFGQHTYYNADKTKVGLTRCMQCGEVRESVRPNPPQDWVDSTIEHSQALCGIRPTKPWPRQEPDDHMQQIMNAAIKHGAVSGTVDDEGNLSITKEELTSLQQKWMNSLGNKQNVSPKDGYRNLMPPCKPPRSETINRIEVISFNGREFVQIVEGGCKPEFHYQDGGKTLKIFLKESK